MSAFRSGSVGLLGRPNTGKSSLLNRLLGQKLAIVSPRAQTTRHLLTGILTGPDYQIAFVDAPGFQIRHRNLLNRSLNRRAGEAARDADVVAFVVEALRFNEQDRAALGRAPEGRPVVAVVNMIDKVRPASRLLPYLARLAALHPFAAVVPVSAVTGRNVGELLRVLRELLPEGPPQYPAEQLTDRDERFFAAELLREKLFRQLGEELPYHCEVRIDTFREEGRLRRIDATLWVEREAHRPIVLGAGGARLKRIATDARRDMERMFGGKVFLQVWVKVRPRWSEDPRLMRELGYT
ncbi:MAG: GTPase Era [Betaproteobacteria bacterium]|nr:GTPase Era [Betaproteobacteria bacterium]MDH5221135.1 GTPase Era [Betaproteobacteria bacterium]MDH5350685.1 GTPase Era [Betaproteobacteria bacterium]